ncbi:MAG: hypothetical protein LBG13_03585 [Holosporales bacterium]|jgi:cytochrome c-type biogenesis protein CcmE|nr:hypothetical protein [Holosporales bacterium]
MKSVVKIVKIVTIGLSAVCFHCSGYCAGHLDVGEAALQEPTPNALGSGLDEMVANRIQEQIEMKRTEVESYQEEILKCQEDINGIQAKINRMVGWDGLPIPDETIHVVYPGGLTGVIEIFSDPVSLVTAKTAKEEELGKLKKDIEEKDKKISELKYLLKADSSAKDVQRQKIQFLVNDFFSQIVINYEVTPDDIELGKNIINIAKGGDNEFLKKELLLLDEIVKGNFNGNILHELGKIFQ